MFSPPTPNSHCRPELVEENCTSLNCSKSLLEQDARRLLCSVSIPYARRIIGYQLTDPAPLWYPHYYNHLVFVTVFPHAQRTSHAVTVYRYGWRYTACISQYLQWKGTSALASLESNPRHERRGDFGRRIQGCAEIILERVSACSKFVSEVLHNAQPGSKWI